MTCYFTDQGVQIYHTVLPGDQPEIRGILCISPIDSGVTEERLDPDTVLALKKEKRKKLFYAGGVFFIQR